MHLDVSQVWHIFVDEMPNHVRKLCPVVGSSALESMSDSEFST